MSEICYEWCNGELQEKPMAVFASFPGSDKKRGDIFLEIEQIL